MTTLRARKSFRYAGRPLRAGDEFEAKRRDDRLLVAARLADIVGPPRPTPPLLKPLDTIQPVEEFIHIEPIAQDLEAPARRTYRRRDLTAE